MTDYSIDWDVTSMNGSADISSSSGGPDLGVTIQSQTLDDDEDIGHASGQLASSYVSLPGSTVISFGSPVTNAAFSVFGFVSGARAGGWSETLSIRAYDADGNEVDVLAEQSDGAGQVMSFSIPASKASSS